MSDVHTRRPLIQLLETWPNGIASCTRSRLTITDRVLHKASHCVLSTCPLRSCITMGDETLEAPLKSTLLSLLLAAFIPISLAAPTLGPGRLTGTQIIERWTAPPSDGSDRTPSQILAREYVDGYLAGVADATQGTVWCNPHAIKPHEVDAEVMGVLKSLPPAQTSRSVAAKLAIAALSKRFPCSGGRK